MGIVAVNSDLISNRDASPKVLNSSYAEKGVPRISAAQLAVTTGDTSTSVYRFFSVPSNARIDALVLNSEDMGTATAGSFGLYDVPTVNAGAVVSVALFATAKDVHSGAIVNSNIIYDNITIDKHEMRVWELLALSADPQKMYDVAFTLTTTSDVGGKMSLKMHHVL